MKFQYLIYLFPILTCWCKSCKTENEVQYIDRKYCIECHKEAYDEYTGSHHDLAMDIANSKTVLGNFNNVTFIHLGDTARFYKHGDNYFVYTKGKDGKYAEFEVVYTFGYTPLQQYLIRFPKGYFQTLPFCWDSRPAEEGGQRWFHIYDQEKIEHDDELYWTEAQQNWNHVCAECHSTELKKNFDVKTLSFNTSWSEIDVSCDACHGPSGNHLKWAELDEKGKSTDKYPNMGYGFRFPNDSAMWIFDMEKGTAFRNKPRTNRQEIELCARCHSRRFQIWDQYVQGEPLMQTHIPDLLETRLYYPDGQIKEEDYVYGSFLQSKMYTQGVTCTDCHNYHSYQVQAPGNILCAKCHVYTKYNSYEHHFHDPDSTGGSCQDCHMPKTRYMVVDPRLDHSIRVPRPDLSDKIGAPNSCIQCHSDKDNKWATYWFKKWYGNKYDTFVHFGEIFHAATIQQPGTSDKLIALISDKEQNEIVRASAVRYIRNYPLMRTVEFLKGQIKDTAAMVRLAAIQTLDEIYQNESLEQTIILAHDSIRAVRYQALSVYSLIPYGNKSGKEKMVTQKQINDYINMLKVNSDQVATFVNLGLLYQNSNNTDSALYYYDIALSLDSNSMETLLNKADVFRQRGNEKEVFNILSECLNKFPESPEVYNSLGMHYTRIKQSVKALEMFKKSMEYSRYNAYFVYIYAIALNSSGNPEKAIEILEHGYQLHPNDYNILYALTSISRESGNITAFEKYYNKLQELQNAMNLTYFLLLLIPVKPSVSFCSVT
ncbi:MAG: hypothetical protein JW894_12635 [Bacteroidales bacterium]|nr:hypothetical protein [Bacteroidales bacterium]